MAKKVYDKKIGKSTDWGGDESTGGLPVAGGRVQEFLKEQLNSKAGVFHYDTTNNRYIVFTDKESQDEYLSDTTKTHLIIGTFDAPFNYSAQITLTSATYVAILAGGKNNYIDFTFDTVNKQGQSVGEDVICTYTFIKGGTKKVVTEKYRYGQSVHFKIDDYISIGTNTVTVGIVGQNTLAATTVGITYQVVDLTLTDTYDISKVYNLPQESSAIAAIPYSVSGYGTKIIEWYLDGKQLDYVKVEDEIVDVSTTRTKYISLANLSQGIHSLQYRAYSMLDGEKFYSNILYRDMMVYTGVNDNPIIAASATIPVGNEILTSGNLQLFGITQYIPYTLDFSVYNPLNVTSTEVIVTVEGNVSATIGTRNGEVNTYSVRATDYGVKTLIIKAGTTLYTMGLNISKSATSLEPTTDALQLDLMALGKSNNDTNREEWVYGLYSSTFSGFNWNKTSGWNNNRLLISNGAYVDVNLAPLSSNPTEVGKTLEFEFSTTNVSDDNAVICDLRNTSGTGLLITASEVLLKSAGGAQVSTKFKSEENIRVAFVINRKMGTANKGLVFVYVNGICSGAVNYAATDNFTSDKSLRIGNTTKSDVQLKALRFYNAALNADQILNNYILYRDTTSEMLSIYDKNNIYEEGTQVFSIDKLTAQCPVFIFTGDIPALENTTDKNKTIYVDVQYVNMQDPTKSFTGKAIRLRPQGTSSMGYPKKNFRPYTGYGEVWDSLGNILVDGLYAFADRAQPVNCWCLKADYAESSGTHNTGIARLWNQCMTNAQVNGEYVLRTAAQKAALAAKYEYDVRTTVDGFPCNVFYRLTADSELIYIGKYNFNNDKSTESVFGFKDIPGFDNSRMQCWEVLNNGNHLALFQDMNNFDAEWDQAYEARYPDKSTNVADLKSFSEWVVSTKGDVAKFKTEKWDHLDVYKVAAYYIFLMRFGAVDQVIKNSMMASEDGLKFYFINYDNDTVNGVRNDGLLIYNYDIDRQTIDESFSALVYAYAGHDSTLWNNLEADEEFMRIVSEVDNALYTAGLSYDKTIDMFDNQQAGKWCERIYNQDAQYKYIGPYTDSGINNLFMMQGNRSAHRRWWLSHRFDLYDSKFVSGAYKSKSIEWKSANTPTGISFTITAGRKLFYGYGLNNVPVEKGIQLDTDESYIFTTQQVINVGDPVRLYAGVNIKALDISNFMQYLSVLNISEVYDPALGTNLRSLRIGDSSSSNRNTSLNNISGLSKAILLEHLDITGFTNITNLDIDNLLYIKAIYALRSGLTSISPANGCPISFLNLPDTMQAIHFDSLPKIGLSGAGIGEFMIENSGRNLTSIFIRNCPNFDSKAFIYRWLDVALNLSVSTIVLENILWTNITPVELIKLGRIKDTGASLTLKGKIEVNSINPEQLEEILYLFGSDCANPDNELYIKFPEGVFISGPSSIIEGQIPQYVCTAISENKGTIEYWLVDNNREVLSVDGVSINNTDGILTTTETGVTRTVIVRGKHIDTTGKVSFADIAVNVNKKIYPNLLTLTGEKLINKKGNYSYTVVASNSTGAINGSYDIVYSLTGDVSENVKIGTFDNNTCILNVIELAPDTNLVLRAEAFRKDEVSIASTTLEISFVVEGVIMTKKSNPEVLKICYERGWCINENYMTKVEASKVESIGSFSRAQITHFEELKYFTGISILDSNCFSYCSTLTSIIIPNGVTSIGDSSFYNCSTLTSIIIPEGVTSISGSCFYNCISLTSIIIPEGVTSIGGNCFYNCRALTSIIIPEGVTSIGGNCFYKCSALLEITVLQNNTNYASIDGVLFNKDKTILNTCPAGKSGDYIIPNGVTSIGDSSFSHCSTLTSIVIPNGVTSIGDSSFSYCSTLTSIVIPNGVTSIGDSCFYDCRALTSIIIPEGVTSIGAGCFYNCRALTSIIIPEGVTSIGSTCFSYCLTLTSIVIPNGVTSIGGSCFYDCRALTSIIIPNGVTSISGSCFYDCIALTSIIIPEGVTILEDRCFKNCISLNSVTLSPLTTIIATEAFYGCTSLTNIDIANVKYLRTSCFGNSGLVDIELPEAITNIPDGAFTGCKSLLTITLGSKIDSIGGSFSGCRKLASIIIKAMIAPRLTDTSVFGTNDLNWVGYPNRAAGTNRLYVPNGATGYDTYLWLNPLCSPTNCGFTLSYSL